MSTCKENAYLNSKPYRDSEREYYALFAEVAGVQAKRFRDGDEPLTVYLVSPARLAACEIYRQRYGMKEIMCDRVVIQAARPITFEDFDVAECLI